MADPSIRESSGSPDLTFARELQDSSTLVIPHVLEASFPGEAWSEASSGRGRNVETVHGPQSLMAYCSSRADNVSRECR